MDRSIILQQAKSYIEQSISGLEAENPKLDFKANWYNLKESRGISEFLKDTSAIANTFGPDGLIIIGFNDKTKEFSNVNFKDSGLRDTSAITDLINKRVDRMFDINIIEDQIDGSNISVIHIPASIDKPHVIKNHQTFDKEGKMIKEEQQRVFIRRGTTTYPASKYDFELMYYDRKNVIPEYRLQCSFDHKKVHLFLPSNPSQTEGGRTSLPIKGSIPITFENLGLRPISIIDLKLSEIADVISQIRQMGVA